MDKRYRVIFAIWFFQVANYLDRVAMSFAGPSIMKSLSLDPASFGVVLSSFGIGYFVAQIPGGLLADRWGTKLLLVVAPLFWALFTGLTGLVATIAGFAIVRFCFGMSEGISNAACYKAIGDNFDSQQRSRAVALWATAFAIAPAFAGPLVSLILGAYGWQSVFFLMAGPAVFAALLNHWLIPGKPAARAARAPDGAPFRDVLGDAGLWLMAATYFGFNIAYWGYLSWMPSYLALEHHIDVKSIGLLGAIPYVCALFGLLLTGWLASGAFYRYRPQLLAATYLLAGLSLFLAYRADTLATSLAGLSTAAFFIFGGLGPFGAIVLELAPERSRAAFSGVINSVGQIAGAAAPFIVGYLVSATGAFASGFGCMIAGLCLAAACLLAVAPRIAARTMPAPEGAATLV